ncbi:stress response translation initiation inhibitor YciH [Aggregatibacter actinomycetemcomitans]|uniref:stress response translation initiation inhibitor YciH n=1 Tax=Aggregatibacter actinomycetemcomitans TaxID=714 RepID=UPI0011D3CF67|nr:stress response translation initiation inhibitor YciH [Aggregatibacter actinomycetemcomitans]TYA51697.1 stress response translation initiation inhibitor YciH [Aggregatibacter actinomycetemcomitans]TYB29797.1 stress response translation initiation inhibitor YciH [Aggregatibacter actinomycetemcomitans]
MTSHLVYSTDVGCIKADKPQEPIPQGDGIVRIQLQKTGRKGSGVSIINGLGLAEPELKALAAELKKRCGCGGAVKNHTIEIQGEKRDLLKQLLEQKGFKVKLAGG